VGGGGGFGGGETFWKMVLGGSAVGGVHKSE